MNARERTAKEYLDYHEEGRNIAALLHGTSWHTTRPVQWEARTHHNIILDTHEEIEGIHANPPFLERPPHEYYGQTDPLRITDEQLQGYQSWKGQLLKLAELGFDASAEAKTNLKLADSRGRIRMDGDEPRQVRSVEIRRGNLSEAQWEAFVDGLTVENKILKLKAMGVREPSKGKQRQIKPTSST